MPAPIQKLTKSIKVILTNQRITPYKSGGSDKIQAKVEVIRRNRLIHEADLPIELWFNYLGGWVKWEDYTTNRFGTKIMHHQCNFVPRIDNCLGYARITYDDKQYDSNIVRFNFIYGQSPEGIEFYIDAHSGATDRSSFDIFDGSGRLNVYDRMF